MIILDSFVCTDVASMATGLAHFFGFKTNVAFRLALGGGGALQFHLVTVVLLILTAL